MSLWIFPFGQDDKKDASMTGEKSRNDGCFSAE